VQEHPDKGGDPEKFKLLSKAYDVLSDPEKRALYDQHGEEGVDRGGGGGGGNPSDIFDMLFGGGGGGGRGGRGGPSGPRKGEDTEHPLRVTLEDLYVGKASKIAVQRSVYEVDPQGSILDRRTGQRCVLQWNRDGLHVHLPFVLPTGTRSRLSAWCWT
jgi:DnaJ-class molecular chaperone